jgi:dTDP-4-amino-4,6-dideoxygalactose transaminase/nucleoside-diphosphate-sugar epimerase
MKRVLILGGAGFIGSNLVGKFCKSGMSVTVIDALFENTGASLKNLNNHFDNIEFIQKDVKDIIELSSILEKNDLIIDSMGWTSHNDAVKDPEYDIRLNLLSHLSVIKALCGQKGKTIIYIGSRGQYGNTSSSEIKEDSALLPEDVQGINKLSGESYYRIYSKFYNYNILSLRIPNCFGENQLINGNDIGLIGNFIKDAINNKIIEVYGSHRKRSVLYVADLVELVYKLSDHFSNGFSAININGTTLLIKDLVRRIINISQSGSFIVKQIPNEINKIDMGSALLSEDKLRKILPNINYTNVDLSLENTINYFKKKITMIWRCDLVPQYELYKKEIDDAIQRVLYSGRYTLSTEVSEFEKEFASYIGCKYGIGVGNATDGLILTMKALDIGEGDEVITTPFTAIPTVSAIIATGATPVFVDIDPDTYLINIELISNAITKKTKAIIPVHLFGNVVDILKLKDILSESIPIIEDASQSHGSKINGIQTGSMGDMGVFSFYPTKNLGAIGDGGMVVTNNEDYNEKLRLLRMYGMTDYNHIKINGINSRLDELQAAILMVKLKHLNEMNDKRNFIASLYRKKLRKDFFIYQKILDNVYSNYHQFVSRTLINRNKIIKYLDLNNIQTNVYYLLPLHLQKANEFLGYKKGDFPIAEKLCDEIIAFTMYPELERNIQTKVIDTINEFKYD